MRPEHPLEGVLDRLLRRERGEAADPVAADGHREAEEREEGNEAPSGVDPAHGRRLLPVAGLDPGGSRHALRLVARWAVAAGRRAAALEVEARVPPPERSERVPGDTTIPIASLPCSPARLRAEPEGRRAAVLHRLSHHERGSDLLLAWISSADRPTLMRAAFLAGALAIPVEEGDRSVHRALGLAREVRQCFDGVAIWAVPVSTTGAQRFARMARKFLDMEVVILENDDPGVADLLERLSPPPDNGFTAALLEPEAQEPSPHLLHLDSLDL